MIERGAPHRSYAGQTEIGGACLQASRRNAGTFRSSSTPSRSTWSLCELAGPDGDEASSLVRGGCKNWSRCILHHPGRLRRAGPRGKGQTRPCCAGDASRTCASEGLAPSQRGHPDLRQGKHQMIAGDRRREREYGCDRDAQGQGPTNGKGELTSGKRQRARNNSDKQCAEDRPRHHEMPTFRH